MTAHTGQSLAPPRLPVDGIVHPYRERERAGQLGSVRLAEFTLSAANGLAVQKSSVAPKLSAALVRTTRPRSRTAAPPPPAPAGTTAPRSDAVCPGAASPAASAWQR